MRCKGNYIGGRFQAPEGTVVTRVSEDPGDLDHPVGSFTFSEEDVNRATEEALRAFPLWQGVSPKLRDQAMVRFQKGLAKRQEELAVLISREMGKPITDARQEVARMVDRIPLARSEASQLWRGVSFAIKPGVKGRLRYKSRGVLGIIGPFNFPAHIPNSQILTSILLGNCVVFKPSEFTPFVGQLLAELWNEVGLPKGVFNLIQGDGRVGRRLAVHEKVHGLIFTGSYATGQRIREETVHQGEKLVALEMGGKNAAIVSRHADLELAAEGCALGAFSMAGQRCNATSRIIIEKKVSRPFVERLRESLEKLKIGYPLDPETTMGPLVSQAAMEKYLSTIALAPREGFEPLREGGRLEREKRGYYVQPSLFLKEVKRGETPAGPYTEEEIFGPNAAVYTVDSLEEAVRIHNSSRYGLVASFYSAQKEEYEKMFRLLEVGLLNWNQSTTLSSGRLPFGGVKRSGSHHPVGSFVPHLCTTPVAVIENRTETRKK